MQRQSDEVLVLEKRAGDLVSLPDMSRKGLAFGLARK